MRLNPILQTDGYKTGHHLMYPEGTNLVYSNFTPRSVKYMPEGAKDIVVFGTQYVVKYIHDLYRDNFFSQPKDKVCADVKTYLSSYLGTDYDISHFEALHDLGYLPIEVKGLDEGTIIDARIPILTIKNTLPEFFWLVNYLETLISSLLWKPMHSASIALGFRKILDSYALKTDKGGAGIVDFQGHDFSMRGMQHPESAISSGLGWLSSFKGTDTIPTLQAADYYYNSKDAGFSVNATEHAVMTAYGKETEIEGFKRLLNLFPTGILSIVSDSFDLWKVCTEYMVELKDDIMSRDGKVVIRPDSGNPTDILCGLENKSGCDIIERDGIKHLKDYQTSLTKEVSEPEIKGVIELLWDVFGGTINEQGYKVLDPHISTIYGDSISIERAEEICERLELKGFASTNVVLGCGSFSLSLASRDSQGSAVKATYVEVNGEGREIFKDPVTDDGTKKSAKGLLQVYRTEGAHGYSKPQLKDQCTWEEESQGLLTTVYKDGKLIKETTLEEIRGRVRNNY